MTLDSDHCRCNFDSAKSAANILSDEITKYEIGGVNSNGCIETGDGGGRSDGVLAHTRVN